MEHDFIRQSQKGLNDTNNYFIAGSAHPERTDPFEYPAPNGYKPINPDPAYSPSQSGKMGNRLRVLCNTIV